MIQPSQSCRNGYPAMEPASYPAHTPRLPLTASCSPSRCWATPPSRRSPRPAPSNFKGKVVIDAMNPLDFSSGFPPKLSISGEDSLGERVQRALPDAKVVKAFNTIGNPYFVDPSFSQGKPTMLIAGDDEGAKRTVGDVLADFGWPDVVDIGGIEGSRELEAICIVWVKVGGTRGAWDHGFALLVA